MNLRCKGGDLAVIIHDTPDCLDNVGRVVEVKGPLTSINGMPAWHIRPVSSALYCVTEFDGSTTRERVTWRGRVAHQDAWMMPIRPKASDDEDVAVEELSKSPELALEV